MNAATCRVWRRAVILPCLMLAWLVAPVRADDTGPPVSPILTAESPYSLAQTLANLRQAIHAGNFRLVRQVPWHGGLMHTKRRDTRATILYFCNFAMVNEVIAVDQRFSQFLPCRMTVSERNGKVFIEAIDPLYISRLLGNDRLGPACHKARDMYLKLMEEATL